MRFNDTVKAPFLSRALVVAAAAGLAMTLALSAPRGATADNDGRGRGCSEETLRGNYGFSIDGQILAGPRQGLLRAVAMTHFDGEGTLSQVDFATINGIPTGTDWRPATGTYAINPDCTGTARIEFTDGSPALKLRLVVIDRGDEVRTIVEGNATGSNGRRVR
jgi:hypothetical protein